MSDINDDIFSNLMFLGNRNKHIQKKDCIKKPIKNEQINNTCQKKPEIETESIYLKKNNIGIKKNCFNDESFVTEYTPYDDIEKIDYHSTLKKIELARNIFFLLKQQLITFIDNLRNLKHDINTKFLDVKNLKYVKNYYISFIETFFYLSNSCLNKKYCNDIVINSNFVKITECDIDKWMHNNNNCIVKSECLSSSSENDNSTDYNNESKNSQKTDESKSSESQKSEESIKSHFIPSNSTYTNSNFTENCDTCSSEIYHMTF